MVQSLYRYKKDEVRSSRFKFSCLSKFKLRLFLALPFNCQRCLSRKEMAYFQAQELLYRETNLIGIVRDLRVMKHVLG